MESINLIGLSVDEFKDLISDIVRKEVQNINSEPQQEDEFLTREETAKILKISLPTLHSYSKKGILQSHRIGRCIRYKKSEIIEAVKEVKNLKYRRL